MIHKIRGWVVPGLVATGLVLALASFWWAAAAWLLAMVVVLLAVAIHDITQTRHSILRTHPLLHQLRRASSAHQFGASP